MSSFICVSWTLDGGMAHNKMFLEEGLQLSYNLTDTLITSKLYMSQSWLAIFKMKSHIPTLFPYFSYLKHHCITYPRQFCDRELSIDLFYSFRHSRVLILSFDCLTIPMILPVHLRHCFMLWIFIPYHFFFLISLELSSLPSFYWLNQRSYKSTF